jgi:hypothetical protein
VLALSVAVLRPACRQCRQATRLLASCFLAVRTPRGLQLRSCPTRSRRPLTTLLSPHVVRVHAAPSALAVLRPACRQATRLLLARCFLAARTPHGLQLRSRPMRSRLLLTTLRSTQAMWAPAAPSALAVLAPLVLKVLAQSDL